MTQAKVISFPSQQLRGLQGPAVLEALQAMATKATEGGMAGLFFMFDDGEGMHHFGWCGSYQESPGTAYMPACKAMYSLSCAISQKGGL